MKHAGTRKATLAVGMVVVLTFGCLSFMQGCSTLCCGKRSSIVFDNEYFYNSDGTFNPERGKDAYIALMKYHGYPVFDGLREKLWVSDYGTGQFTKLGLGAIGFINDQESGYLGQDMFLLPGQMLPEHYHLRTEKGRAKMEGWQPSRWATKRFCTSAKRRSSTEKPRDTGSSVVRKGPLFPNTGYSTTTTVSGILTRS